MATSTSEYQHDEPSSPALAPWERFSRWLHCVCIVVFDLELGQAIEDVYPAEAELSTSEKRNICYLSFPDSNSAAMGDTQFHFRIRSDRRLELDSSEVLVDRDSPAVLKPDIAHYYGFVYFRQEKDSTSKRGYMQKSVVLLSRLPYVKFFSVISKTVAEGYFEHGMVSIESSCHDIDQWRLPIPGRTLQLPISGKVLQIRIPSKKDKPGAVSSPEVYGQAIPAVTIVSSVQDVDSFSCLQPVLPHLNVLWELVLVGEPIVVMASTPDICATTVQALINMIKPLKYASDFRPYFTIHDNEFKEYTTKTQAPPSIILGVTNPYFAKTLQHWPHVLVVDSCSNPGLSSTIKRTKNLKGLTTLDTTPGLYTKYLPTMKEDKFIIRRLLKQVPPGTRPQEAQNAMLTRHFLEQTQSFIIPLERYITTLMPLQKNISPWKSAPNLKPFDVEEFIRSLNKAGPQLTSDIKGNWQTLYRKFFKSPNFDGWLRSRQAEILEALQLRQIEMMGAADITAYIKGKAEVEIVDLILRLKDKLVNIKCNNSNVSISEVTRHRLTEHLIFVVSILPPDLQGILKNI
ncbi:uncharacterized protein TRIADDRAFT_23603 [Trichoplax adhaerens]|uniref:UDENN domain-containing protein n=1 Tax=Trichoplax adhaerens TaxID=10228 RepID=B3RUN7_TRIAD|nr:hypothetical protein TRIADDRAFT_23603 [Trichoplax adhaerens]EDV25356.1 hypothetical protein TRIADDRAFT_23603 [Trichoplax adhaerens]|eukprot:XP_002111389.1 hypothetical protein TRIADDRAFT_23603 [Trichoplax adhaerens]